MAKKARKYLAHFLDANFGKGTPNYVRLGKDLEELNEELNPDVEVKQNILGEQSVDHKGYKVQSEVNPYYADEDDPLYEPIQEIANERLTGASCETTKVDVMLNADGTVKWAYREKVAVIPTQNGGDTSGVQIPFTIYNGGERVKGNFDLETRTFSESAAAPSAPTGPQTTQGEEEDEDEGNE